MARPTKGQSSKPKSKKRFFDWIRRHAKFGLFTTIIGVVTFISFILLHNTYDQPSNEYFWGALISIPVTIFCMGIFSVFYEWYLRNNFTKAMRSVNSSWDTGVHVLSSHEDAPDRLEELLKAHEAVKLMSTTFSQYFANIGGVREIEAIIREKNVKFKFIIYEPGSKAVEEKAFEENTVAKKFNDEIKNTCCSFLGPLKQKYPSNIKVRFCPFNTPFGITIIDDVRMILSLNIYGLVRSKNETPCLIIQNRYEPGSVFKQYDNSFDAIWEKLNDNTPLLVQECF